MFTPSKLNRIALAVAVSIGFATPVFAQETSSGLSGKVVTYRWKLELEDRN